MTPSRMQDLARPSALPRLETGASNSLAGDYCSLCAYILGGKGANDVEVVRSPCDHRRPHMATSDSSFYTANSARWSSSSSGTSSSSVVRANIRPPTPHRQPPLRRRYSPTEVSLRELSDWQANKSALRAKESEEALQQKYESQILLYLNGGFADIEHVVE